MLAVHVWPLCQHTSLFIRYIIFDYFTLFFPHHHHHLLTWLHLCTLCVTWPCSCRHNCHSIHQWSASHTACWCVITQKIGGRPIDYIKLPNEFRWLKSVFLLIKTKKEQNIDRLPVGADGRRLFISHMHACAVAYIIILAVYICLPCLFPRGLYIKVEREFTFILTFWAALSSLW